MSDPSYTPEPWRAVPYYTGRHNIPRICGGDGLLTQVASVYLAYTDGKPNQRLTEANAHMLAAAPLLYAAAKEADHLFAHALGSHDTDTENAERNFRECVRILEQFHAAIRTAEGGHD